MDMLSCSRKKNEKGIKALIDKYNVDESFFDASGMSGISYSLLCFAE